MSWDVSVQVIHSNMNNMLFHARFKMQGQDFYDVLEIFASFPEITCIKMCLY